MGWLARVLVLVLAIVLGSWAGVSSLLAVSTAGLQQAGANATKPPAPAATTSPSTTAAPAASASPSPLAPTPSPPPAEAGQPLPRPRVTVVPVREQLQAELDRLRSQYGIPGISATIFFRDGTSWTGNSGFADVAGGTKVADDTAFALGSVSKTYTAALILALAGEGAIDLDAPAAGYLGGLPLDPGITVRMLLDHTSGLDDYFLHASIDRALQADRGAAWSARRTLGFVAKPYFAPGKGWHYSNTNYLYLGLIAERVTGKQLGIALNERFFAPLGLDATWYQAAEKPRAPTAHGYRFNGTKRSATPIDMSDGSDIVPFTSVVTAAAGAGSIASTSADAAEWARLLYTGEVLGPDMTAQMLNGTVATAGYRPRVPYGLGVQAFPIDGRPTVGHSGRLLGDLVPRCVESEWREEALVEGDAEVRPGDPFRDQPEIEVVRVRVVPASARREVGLGDEPQRPLDRPGRAAVGLERLVDGCVEEVVVEAARVVEQHPDRDLRIKGRLWQIGDRGCIEIDLAVAGQREDQRGSVRLADAAEGERGVVVDGDLVADVGQAAVARPRRAVAEDDRHRDAGDAETGPHRIQLDLEPIADRHGRDPRARRRLMGGVRWRRRRGRSRRG